MRQVSEAFAISCAALPGAVNRVETDVKEEWIRALAADELHRLAREAVRQVLFAFVCGTPALRLARTHAGRSGGVTTDVAAVELRVVVGFPFDEIVHFIKYLGRRPHDVPFADARGAI